MKYDKSLCKQNKGIYTFKVRGQMYHFINELEPSSDKLSHLQLYFYDTDHEVENRLKFSENLRAETLWKLIQTLQPNPYSRFFRSLTSINDLDTHQIVIRTNPNLDQRVYNSPSVSQVAVVWIENANSNKPSKRDILIRRLSRQSERIQYYYGCHDPLQYPLLFHLEKLVGIMV